MKIKSFPIIIIVIFSIIFVIFYKSLQNSNIYIPKTLNDKEIPSFNAKIFNTNNKISSEEIFKKDQFYLMNIWASWCIPCRDEHVYLMELSKQKRLIVVGLNYKDNDEKAKYFLNKLSSPYEIILSDSDGLISIECSPMDLI